MSEKDPKDPNAPKDSAWYEGPGAKPGKFQAKAPSAKAEKEYKKEGAKKEVKWGDRKPKPEDPDKTKADGADKPKKAGKSSAEVSTKALGSKTLADMVWQTTREGDEDKTYYEAASFKADAEALAASFDAKELQGKVTVAKAKAEFKAAHGQIDLVEAISNFFFGKPKPAVSSAPFSWTTPMRQDASGRHVKEDEEEAQATPILG